MAKRTKKRATPRAASGREQPPREPSEGEGASAESRPTAARILEAVTQVLQQAAVLGRHHPLGRLATVVVLQTLEWQSMVLEVYQRMLRDDALDTPTEEQLRRVARSMMSAYLDLAKSAPERRERLLAGQAELTRAFAEAIEEMRDRLAPPVSSPRTRAR